MNFIKCTFLFVITAAILSGCGSSTRFTSDNEKGSATEQPRQDEPNNNNDNTDSGNTDNSDYSEYNDYAPLEVVTGVASYYADKYNGRPTSSGEIYDMYGISAAHPTYPMFTVIRVTNLKNNRHVVLKINDRMPYRPDRIIDLSYGAAKELDMVNDGIVNVKIEVLKWGSDKKGGN